MKIETVIIPKLKKGEKLMVTFDINPSQREVDLFAHIFNDFMNDDTKSVIVCPSNFNIKLAKEDHQTNKWNRLLK